MLTEETIIDGKLPPKQPGEFRIAHLSDLHLSAGKGSIVSRIQKLVYHSRPNGLDAIRSVLADLPSADIDHVVITGDLTESAGPEEYEDAAHLLRHMDDPSILSVIPGNHDVCYGRKRAPRVSPLGMPMKLGRFMDHFGALIPDTYPEELSLEKRRPFPFVKFLENSKIALIGIDTTSRVPRRALPINALGTVGKWQFREIERILASEALREKTKVILMHHHLLLIPISTWGDSVRGLRKSRQLLELFYGARVDLVLHGHKHHPFCWHSHTFQRHNFAIICAGPPNAKWMDATRVEEKLVYNIYSFHNGLVRLFYRECPHRHRQNVTTFTHQRQHLPSSP